MAEAKKVLLNTSERVHCVTILNQFKGELETLGQVLEDLKEIGLTDEDKIVCDWMEVKDDVKDPGKTTGFKWDDEKGGEKEVAFQDKTLEYVRSFIKEKNEKGEFTTQDRPIIQLSEKLK